ncbi:bacteriophage holin [Lactococcus lactis]|uniref:bacteriophage holin n=1 Tax=Lactococcus lactis TaxID=1358 RepID=UPI00288030EB|nr:bacteriophage holin [Lactococcus lactis]
MIHLRNKLYNTFIPKKTFIKFTPSVPLLTGALFLCYNIVGMFVRFHPISRVKLLFGVAFFIFQIKP